MLLALCLLPSCSDVAAHATAPSKTPHAEVSAMTILLPEAPELDTTPPAPTFDLPELPFDKAQLKGVKKLDAMITEAVYIDAATMDVQASLEALRASAGASLNGTNADQIKALMGIIDGFERFEQRAVPMAAIARKRFVDAYADDEAFSSLYRATYRDAEDELDTAITDNVVRRATLAAMHQSYKMPPRTTLEQLDSSLGQHQELRTKAIANVVGSAETSLMVADFKKGRALVDLLQGARGSLRLVRTLDEGNEKIAAALKLIDEKELSRAEEVDKARESFRMPERFARSGAPKNAAELEESVHKALEAEGYTVHAVHVASQWIAVRSPLGIHMYDQIDFHVAVASSIQSEAKAGVLDVLYVTGKTAGTSRELPFGRYSAGCIAQMLAKNL